MNPETIAPYVLEVPYENINWRHKFGKLAAAALLLGGAMVGTGVETVIDVTPAAAYDSSTGDYPWSDADHVAASIAGDNLTWGYESKMTCDDRSDGSDCSTFKRGTYYTRDPWQYDLRNCTSYVAWRLAKEFGVNASGMENATKWNNHATEKGWSVDNSPEVGDIAQWEGDDQNQYAHPGHVAFVKEVGTGANAGKVKIDEYNQGLDGKYRGDRWVVADHYIDVNGPNPPGFTLKVGDSTGGGSTTPPPRMMIINGSGAAYTKDQLTSGGWTPMSASGDARTIAVGGRKMMFINSAQGAYVSDTPETGWTPLTSNGDAQAIDVDTTGQMALINACGAAYARNPGTSGWVQETNCGDAKAIATGGGRLMLINACGGAYAKDGLYDGWTEVLACGDAQKIAVGESKRMMVINGCGGAFARNNIANDGWRPKTACGDATAIAYGKDRMMIITAGGAAYAGDNVDSGLTRVTADGDAKAIAVGSNDRMMIINSANAAYAKDTISDGISNWTWQTVNGDAVAIAVG